MEKIGIITDEAADLPKDIVEKHDIAVVQVKLFWPEIENLPGENTFQKMRELEKKGLKSFGKTSQPSMKDFLDKYNLQLGRFEKVLCFTLTSKLSGTYNSAVQAKKFLEEEKREKVFVIDTLNVSAGQALLILKAIDLIQEGRARVEEIAKLLEEFVPQVHLLAMFEDPKWVEASGRISHLVAGLMRGMARVGIRPVMALKEGVLSPAGVKVGAKEITLGLFKQFEADTKKLRERGAKIRAAITHGDNLSGARTLKEMIEKECQNAEVVFLNIINNVVGAPAGPGVLALGWCQI